MDVTQLLSQNPIYAHLSDSDRANLAGLAISRDYPKDQWITHYGDIWPYLFIVENGIVSAIKESYEGRSLLIATIRPGETFWGLAFFLETAPMPVALVAGEACRIHLWSREHFLPYLLGNGHMSWELSRQMVTRMQTASEMVEVLAFQPVAGRLANLLLDRYGDAVEDYVARDLTLDEMAARIGSTRETVCRVLYRLAEDGSIHIKRTEFMITDRDKLENHAGIIKGNEK